MAPNPDVTAALNEAVSIAAHAMRRGAAQRSRSDGLARIERVWLADVGCHLIVTHQRIEGEPRLVDTLARVFFAAGRLPAQPWYDGFRSGEVEAWAGALPDGVERAALATSVVDVGLRALRAYRVLCTDVPVSETARFIGLQSIEAGPRVPDGVVEALLWPPSGDLFVYEGGALHWHHLLVAPGIGLGPRWFDRRLFALLRTLGITGQEYATYRGEAEGLARFVAETDLDAWCATHDVS